jgi:two-component system, LuxR family, sensor kinase FixL
LGYREQKLPSASILGTLQLTNPKYWTIGIAFLAIYLTLNTLTRWYQYDELGITLWSPDDGLSLLLLIEGTAFAPFVLVGEVLADVFINRVNHSLYATVVAEFALTVGYVALACFLRDRLRFDPRRADFANAITLLIAVPVATTFTSLAYCGSLHLTGSLPSGEFYSAMRHFWIGDTVGMIVIIPTATAVFIFLSKERWRWSSYDVVSCLGFIVGTCLAFAALIGAGRARDHDLFYLLFLPVIWMGMLQGYAGVAIALLVIQLVLFLTAAHLGFEWDDFDVLQLLTLVLSITGLVLGAVITEREQASRLLREQRTELARMSAYATAGAMGMMLAHEISQPLSTVAAYLHAARRMLQSVATVGPAMEALGKAESETRRTREVLERVRDFVSSGKLELAPLDVLDIARKIRALCAEEANACNVYVEVEGVRPIPLVTADRVGIEQILYNIVANAIDAASERRDAHGVVIVHVAGHDDRVVVQIDDNGPGIAPEMAESLFEAYQTTKPRGMGLGLPLSLQIVKMHAGRLWCQPNVPEGTRFVVELPIDGPGDGAA